ncbi:uncharacterized protein LOC143834260 isoform X3 [Paroedura picta]|uniref:uncharacterized protein LOC143834260 isoform X3 n=1 Tax=Paroedura picta TaxID=143630 RepID=UPI00405771C6
MRRVRRAKRTQTKARQRKEILDVMRKMEQINDSRVPDLQRPPDTEALSDVHSEFSVATVKVEKVKVEEEEKPLVPDIQVNEEGLPGMIIKVEPGEEPWVSELKVEETATVSGVQSAQEMVVTACPTDKINIAGTNSSTLVIPAGQAALPVVLLIQSGVESAPVRNEAGSKKNESSSPGQALPAVCVENGMKPRSQPPSQPSASQASSLLPLTSGRGPTWKDAEVRDVLAIFSEEKVQDALNASYRNREIFEQVAMKMRALGHNRSGLECRSKTKTMRAEYFRCVAHNRENGATPVTCPYFDILKGIYGDSDGDWRPKRVPRNLTSKKRRYAMEEVGQQLSDDPDEGPSTSRSRQATPATPERIPVTEMVTLNLFQITPGDQAIVRCPTPLTSVTQLPEPSTPVIQEMSPRGEDYQDSDSSATENDDIPPTPTVRTAAVPQLQYAPGPRDAPGDKMSGDDKEEPAAERPADVPSGGLSAEERLLRERRRQKRISLLTSLGQKLLKQGEEDMRQCRAVADAMVRLEKERMDRNEALANRAMENTREEARLAREAFTTSMQESNAILRGTAQSIDRMGDLVERIVVLMEARARGNHNRATPPPPTARPSQNSPLLELAKDRRPDVWSKGNK